MLSMAQQLKLISAVVRKSAKHYPGTSESSAAYHRTAEEARQRRAEILAYLRKNGRKSIRDLNEHFGVLNTTMHSYINRMIDDGEVRAVSGKYRRYFEAVK